MNCRHYLLETSSRSHNKKACGHAIVDSASTESLDVLCCSCKERDWFLCAPEPLQAVVVLDKRCNWLEEGLFYYWSDHAGLFFSLRLQFCFVFQYI